MVAEKPPKVTSFVEVTDLDKLQGDQAAATSPGTERQGGIDLIGLGAAGLREVGPAAAAAAESSATGLMMLAGLEPAGQILADARHEHTLSPSTAPSTTTPEPSLFLS